MTLINKTDLLDNIKRTIDTLQAHGDANYIRGLRDAMRIVEAAPAIEQERKKGRWIGKHKMGVFSHPDSITYECSECGYSIYTVYGMPRLTDFCPWCGAEMKGEEE